MNCCVVPRANEKSGGGKLLVEALLAVAKLRFGVTLDVDDWLAGTTVMEDKTGGPTVMLTELETDPDVAEMLALPCDWLCASPELLMVITLGLLEAQVTELVTSCVEL